MRIRLSTFSRKTWSFRSLSLLGVIGLLVMGLVFSISSRAMAASPAFVQTKTTSVGSAKTVSISLPTTSAGNLLAVYIDWNNVGSVALTDNKGDTFASAGAATKFGSSLNYSSQVFYAKNIAGGATTVTATFPTNTGADMYVQEYSGLDKTNPLDASVSAKGSSKTPNSGTVATTNAQDLIFGAGANLSGSMVAGSGFTARSTAQGNIVEDKNVTTAGTYSANATISVTGQWVMHMVAFKAAPAADTTAPSVPTNVTATAVSPTQINLSWNAATDNVGVTGYKIYRNGAQIGTTTGTTYSNTGLTASTTYTYTVSAYDAAGNNSAQTGGVSATTQAPPDTTPPSVPANLAANATSSAQIALTWSAATDNVGVAGYTVYRNGTQVGTATSAAYQDTGLTASTTYSYTVSAFDAAGNTSPQTAPASATTQTPDTTAPTAPANLTANATSPSQIALSWDASTDDVGVTGYRVTRDGAVIANVASTSYNDTGLAPDTSHTYTVAAVDAAGNASADSPSATATTPTPPADTTPPTAPTNLSTTVISATQINVAWAAATDDTGVTAYKISRNGTEIATVTGTTYSDTSLAASTSYTYTVTAVDAAGNVSPSSDPVTATTMATALANRPAQAASVMYGDGGDTARASTYAHPGGLVAAGRTNYQDQVFKDISAAGGSVLIYLDPIISNNWGPYHSMLLDASACGPAVPHWPGNPQANQWGYLNDFRVGGVLQSKLECVLEKMVADNPHMAGWFADDVGSRSWFPNFNWSTWGATNQQAYRDGAIAITQTFRKVADRHGLMFVVNGTWGAGTLASSGGGYPDMNQHGNALADGGFVEHHSTSELPYWSSYACSTQWASQSALTRGTAFMWAVTTTNSERDAYTNSGCFAFVNNQPSAIYDYAAPWGTAHATGLPSKVSGPISF